MTGAMGSMLFFKTCIFKRLLLKEGSAVAEWSAALKWGTNVVRVP